MKRVGTIIHYALAPIDPVFHPLIPFLNPCEHCVSLTGRNELWPLRLSIPGTFMVSNVPLAPSHLHPLLITRNDPRRNLQVKLRTALAKHTLRLVQII